MCAARSSVTTARNGNLGCMPSDWRQPGSAIYGFLRVACRGTTIDANVVRETVGVCGGYPCVGTSRIPVRSLVLAYRKLEDLALLIETFPTLTPAEIQVALDWYI